MELLEAVKTVLTQNKKPMHFKEIAKIVTVQKLAERGAQTMETMINARVALDIKKGEKLRAPSLFLKLHNGMIGLRTYEEPKPPAAEAPEAAAPQAPPEQTLPAAPEAKFAEAAVVRAAYVEKLTKMHFLSFERILENLFREMKIARYTVVNRRTDGGIDYAINFQHFDNNVNMLLVVRRWPAARKMNARNFEEINSVMAAHKFNSCAVLAFSGFEPEVVEQAKNVIRQPLFLLDAGHLCDLLIKYNVGLARKVVESYAIDDQYIAKIEDEVMQKVEQHRKRPGDQGGQRHQQGGAHGGAQQGGSHPAQGGQQQRGGRKQSHGKHHSSQQFKRRNREDDIARNDETGEHAENKEDRDQRNGRNNREQTGGKQEKVITHRRVESYIDNL